MEEVWKDIKGYEGLYQVSNLGKVKSLSRVQVRCGKPYNSKERIRKLILDKDGYKNVCLRLNKKAKLYKVHRLVAEHFILNPNNYKEVNHKDENKANNHYENLEWCDRKHNVTWNNLHKRNAEKNKNGKLAKAILQLTSDNEIIACYPSLREAERITGFSHGNISNCINGHLKTYKGYIWKFRRDMNIGDLIMENQ